MAEATVDVCKSSPYRNSSMRTVFPELIGPTAALSIAHCTTAYPMAPPPGPLYHRLSPGAATLTLPLCPLCYIHTVLCHPVGCCRLLMRSGPGSSSELSAVWEEAAQGKEAIHLAELVSVVEVPSEICVAMQSACT